MSDPREGAPAEGLPPCIKRVAIFEGRQATWHIRESCPDPSNQTSRCGHYVCAGQRGGKRCSYHSGVDLELLHKPVVLEAFTDDPAEAKAAFERGAEWVRTGIS